MFKLAFYMYNCRMHITPFSLLQLFYARLLVQIIFTPGRLRYLWWWYPGEILYFPVARTINANYLWDLLKPFWLKFRFFTSLTLANDQCPLPWLVLRNLFNQNQQQGSAIFVDDFEVHYRFQLSMANIISNNHCTTWHDRRDSIKIYYVCIKVLAVLPLLFCLRLH